MTTKGRRAQRILILEDEAVVALELEMRLGALGYEVEGPVATLDEALALAARRHPDLVLADIQIPGGGDGIDAVRLLRERFGVPAVYLTAHTDTTTLARAVESAPFGYLTKPFREAELHATIQMALHRAALERKLAEREKQLADAQRIGNVGHWSWDVPANRSDWSAQTLTIFGATRAEVEADPLGTFLARVHPEDRARVEADIAASLRGAGRLVHAYRVVRPDGTTRHVHAWVESAADERGQVARVVGVSQDVTEQVQAAAAVRSAQRRFEALFDGSPDALVVVDGAGVIRLANATTQAILGYAPEELVGLPVERLVPEATRARHVSDRSEFGRAPTPRTMASRAPVAALTRDGREVPVEIGLSPIEVDGERLVIAAVRDVSGRVAAEDARRESDTRYRALFDQAAVGVAEIDCLSGRLLRVNQKYTQILGRDAASLLAADCMQLTHPDDQAAHLALMAQLRAGIIRERQLEKRLLRGDGSVVWVNLSVAAVLPAGDRPTTLVAVIEDISGRKRAEGELEAQRALLQKVFDANPALMMVKDLEGRYAFVNQAFTELAGKARHEILGRTDAELVGLGGLGESLAADAAAPGRESAPPGQTVSATIRGGRRWFQRYETALTLEERPHVLCVLVDVTGRLQLEEYLRRATADLQAMLAAFPDLLFRLDAKGRILDFRAASLSDLYTQPEVFLGRPFSDVLPPEVGRALEEALTVTRRTGAIQSVEYELELGGSRKAYEARIAPSNPDELLTIVRDITERRSAERALSESEERLRQAQKLDAIGRLAGGISHDFNNLLSVILGMSALLADMLRDDVRAMPLVRDVLDASQRAASLTQQLLAFARKRPAAPQLLDLNQQLEVFARLLRRTLGVGFELVTEPAPDLWPVLLDPSHFEQLVLNLVLNARDAMPAGGRLALRTRNVAGETADEGCEHWVELEVQDGGLGMTEDVRARLFEPFFTTKGVGKGTGLGLATVYGVVRQAGGQLAVESRLGEGSTFRIRFPRAAGTRAAQGVVASTRAFSGRERVLIVEDDAKVREVHVRVLTGAGYRVLEAGNGHEALATVGAQPVDLVLTDVAMPGMDGAELASRLERDHPSIPLLFVSGFAADAAVLERFGPVLAKPLLPDALLRAVRRTLDEE